MPKIPILKPQTVIQALQRGGFVIHHYTGSHARLVHATDAKRKVTVPVHNKDIPNGTMANILKQAQLTVEELINLL